MQSWPGMERHIWGKIIENRVQPMNQHTKAGWASCDITPFLGLPMGGREPSLTGNGTEILAPLQAGVTILEDQSGERLVFLSLDLCDMSVNLSEMLVRDIAHTVGTTPEAVVINCSHTHSGPMMAIEHYATLVRGPEELQTYIQELHFKVIRATLQALESLQPVRVAWHDGQSNIGINRRLPADEDFLMGPNEEGCYHRHLWVLAIQALNSDGRCLLFSHACHPVMVYSYAWTGISPDWPGECRNALQETLGKDVHCQFLQGLAGNIRPRILADFENKKFRPARPEEVVEVGGQIARDIVRALDTPGEELALQLAAERGWFLARQEPASPCEFWQEMLESPIEIERIVAKYWLSRYEENSIPPFPTQSIPLGMVQLAPRYALVYLSWEPLSEWFEVLQAALPEYRLVAVGYTHHTAGYLPTDELLGEGGYETKRASVYYRNGPGSFLPGLNSSMRRNLLAMKAGIDSKIAGRTASQSHV